MYVCARQTWILCLYCLFLIQDRCSSKQNGDLGTADGIIGFGAGSSSVISQLAAAGTVKKMFAHCLDGDNGGGIFAIGQVVEPIVNSIPFLPNRYVK